MLLTTSPIQPPEPQVAAKYVNCGHCNGELNFTFHFTLITLAISSLVYMVAAQLDMQP